MKKLILLTTAILFAGSIHAKEYHVFVKGLSKPDRISKSCTIIHKRNVPDQVKLAGKELRRYIYLRTGQLLPISDKMPKKGNAIILGLDNAMGAQEYRLKTIEKKDRWMLRITGGSATGLLYGVYDLAGKLGVRFQLDCDIIPDKKVKLALSFLDEKHSPIFETRGINPFHDFSEGPDWWNTDDYLVYVTQLARMRMNFMGLHCYPQGNVGPEPLVWIGQDGEFDKKNGEVKKSYRSRWVATTGDGKAWGYTDTPSSRFVAGSSQLFESDMYGPDVMAGVEYNKQTPDDSNALFNRTGAMLNTVFTRAKQLGLKTCIGTETPLIIPKDVKARITKAGKNINDPEVKKEVYQAMFARIKATHPLDYYWLWTPEGWTWGGNKPAQYKATVSDLNAALDALKALDNPFTLATCGWVLGPAHDRSALDKDLPETSPMSCINRKVGHDPVEPKFVNVKGRPKWAIPWMENDPNMVGPQPWVGRMRADAVDAKKYGCTGLLGIHWRTRIISQNVTALAQAGWDQSWSTGGGAVKKTGALDGQVSSFADPVENTKEDPIYQKVRFNVHGYRLEIPAGTYTVTLKFNEPYFAEAGKRRFGAKIQGEIVFDQLDMFAKAGKNKAIDVVTEKIRVDDGVLNIDFVYDIEFPCIAGIEVVGTKDAVNQFKAAPYSRRINCGGGVWKKYEADKSVAAVGGKARSMPVKDFYFDWCTARFGEEVAEQTATIFVKTDGLAYPEISGWWKGPGGVKPCRSAWAAESNRFAFVDEMAALRKKVKGAGNLERFDYWLDTFEYSMVMRKFACGRAQLDSLMGPVNKEKDKAKKAQLAKGALAVRVGMARDWEKAIMHQIAAVQTPGELGTIMNLEEHTRVFQRMLGAHDKVLAGALGKELPEEAKLSMDYKGPNRIIVPTERTIADKGEIVAIKAILLAKKKVDDAVIKYRPLGGKKWKEIEIKPIARAVYKVALPELTEDIEYYIEAELDGKSHVWPATAPDLNHTVVVK